MCKHPTAIMIHDGKVLGFFEKWERMGEQADNMLRSLDADGYDYATAVDCLEAAYLADPEERDGERDGWDTE